MLGELLRLSALLYTGLLIACLPNSNDNQAMQGEQTMPDITLRSIAGTWNKWTAEPCARAYPAQVKFMETGVYLSTTDEKEFSLWQSGDFMLVGDNRISIQTANDAMVDYGVSLKEDDTLVFVDENNCEFAYVRAR